MVALRPDLRIIRLPTPAAGLADPGDDPALMRQLLDTARPQALLLLGAGLLVALIAAAAGVLSLTSAKVGGQSGVFISVTTVPAAGNVALGIAFGAWGEVAGSSIQLALNISGMVLAGWATLALQHVIWSRMARHRARVLAEAARSTP